MKHIALYGGAAVVALLASGCYQASTTQSAASSSSVSSSASATAQTPATEQPSNPSAAPQASPSAAQPAAGEVEIAGGLKYVDLKVGDGEIAEAGETATVHYTGWLTDGTKFDSSVDRNEPYPFRVGAGSVIRGWDEGVKGMRVGGKRHLTIPPDMAYGSNGRPPVIPPNATLVFDVELLSLAH